jgi:hypothetical protein
MRWGILLGTVLVIVLVMTPGCVTPQKDGANKSTSSVVIETPGPTVTVTPTQTPLPPEADSLRQVTPYHESSVTRTSGTGPTPGPDTSEDTYVEIFHNTTMFLHGPVAYAYDLAQPPMIITLQITPNQTERDIFITNKSQSKKGDDEIIKVTGDSPDSWMLVTVRDLNTGSVVLQEGFGKTYSSDRNRRLVIRTSGAYQIDFNGGAMKLDIIMKVKKSGP